MTAYLGVLCVSFPANAIETNRYSTNEIVGFAFYQLGNFTPNFEDWVKQSEKYHKATPVEKVQLLQTDVYRLQNGFFNFMPDTDLITLELEARIEVSNYYQESQRGDKETTVRFTIEDLPEGYIPFQVGEMWVAIVIKDYDLQREISFTSEEYKDFAAKFGLNRGAYQMFHNIGIRLKLRPVSVDTDMPITLEGVDMWLMLAETAELLLYRKNNKEDYFYEYQAPWFVSENHRELLRLYRQ